MRRRYDLRLISAAQALSAQQEALALGGSSLARNACVLARALYRGKRRVFADGSEVLRTFPGQTVACWMGQYDKLCRLQAHSWQQDLELLRQDTPGRLRWKALQMLGLLPRDMDDGQLMTCVMHLQLDAEEQLEKLCPACRRQTEQAACPVCGAAAMTVNPKFDPKRFEELKNNGSSAMDYDPAGPALSPAADLDGGASWEA